ncbi:hypothetical protein [Paenibacillus sp. MBLB4367]|uniref:hypothetical protein n=1 Tax=Paenibacillus sp. MBLB4367 TaxID=3384767 RepID=UPI0039084280
MEIGVINTLANGGDCFGHVSRFGLHVCQLVSWDTGLTTQEVAEQVVREAKAADVRVCAMWAGVPGPAEWNFTEGPVTLGFVPEAYRDARIDALKSTTT